MIEELRAEVQAVASELKDCTQLLLSKHAKLKREVIALNYRLDISDRRLKAAIESSAAQRNKLASLERRTRNT